jgi:predicted N-acetyltransferase YhbS
MRGKKITLNSIQRTDFFQRDGVRFGFEPSRKYNITSEYDVPPEDFMIIELQPGFLTGKSGIAKYHETFAEL